MSLRPEKYISRLIDDKVRLYLSLFGAVSIEGPKWCGKTWTAMAHSESMVNLDDEEVRRNVEISTEYAFTNNPPELLDERNRVPKIWDAVRRRCDRLGTKGNFILTCSTRLPSQEEREKIFHSGAGRMGRIIMRTMSLYESGNSSGAVSLKRILEGTQKNVRTDKVELKELAYYIVRGGWPSNLDAPSDYAGVLPKSYISYTLLNDINRDKDRNSKKMELLLKSLARNESAIAGNMTLVKDIDELSSERDIQVSRNTVDDYLDVLTRLHIIEDQPAYSTNYRSSLRVGKTAVRRFVDPSLACAVLDLNADKLLSDLSTFGLLFESLVIRDLRVYTEVLDGKVYHFRDNESGDEVDAILEFPGGDYAAVEVKLGDIAVNDAIKGLTKFSEKVEKKPKFMMVIVGVGTHAYKDPDSGIYVVPITSLRS